MLEGPLASVRGLRPHELADEGVPEPFVSLWVAVRVALRSVLDEVTVADLAEDHLPEEGPQAPRHRREPGRPADLTGRIPELASRIYAGRVSRMLRGHRALTLLPAAAGPDPRV